MKNLNFYFKEALFLIPKDQNSYLYLAKIYKFEDNKKKRKKILILCFFRSPKNEEAMYILMEIELKKSNYSKVKELAMNFSKICNNICVTKKL